MKNFFKLMPILCLFLAASCSKDNTGRDETLTGGKWKLSETLSDPGDGSGKWRHVSEKSRIDNIIFKDNGELEWDLYGDFKTYAIKDSVTLSLIRADKSVQTYFYEVKDGKLTMSPREPARCIEACGSKYVKIRSAQ